MAVSTSVPFLGRPRRIPRAFARSRVGPTCDEVTPATTDHKDLITSQGRSNMHVGGRPEKSDLAARDYEICAAIGPKSCPYSSASGAVAIGNRIEDTPAILSDHLVMLIIRPYEAASARADVRPARRLAASSTGPARLSPGLAGARARWLHCDLSSIPGGPAPSRRARARAAPLR